MNEIRRVEKSGISTETKVAGVQGSNPCTATNLYEKLRKSYRPWKDKSEVPKHALIKHRGNAYDGKFPMALTLDCIEESNTDEIKIHFKRTFGINITTLWGVHPLGEYDNVFWHMVHSTDGGKTWHPCGVKIK